LKVSQQYILIMKASNLGLVTSTLIGKEESKQPVDWKTLGLLDYPTVITHPMDLTTVKYKLAGNCYTIVEDCLSEIQQIWDNCKLYNAKETVTEVAI
jgi:hypothetical protein